MSHERNNLAKSEAKYAARKLADACRLSVYQECVETDKQLSPN